MRRTGPQIVGFQVELTTTAARNSFVNGFLQAQFHLPPTSTWTMGWAEVLGQQVVKWSRRPTV